MKYLPLHALILAGLSVFLTGCYHDFDYDLTRSHDIYRMKYNYKPQPAPDTVPAAGAGAPAISGQQVAPTTAPASAQPAVPSMQ